MKLNLNLEFDSIAEMQDWILREAAQLSSFPYIDAQTEPEPVDKLEPKPAKPKRKRRTKAEMAAARAAAASEPEPEPAPELEPATEAGVELGTEPEPPVEVEVEAAAPAGGNGSGELAELQKRFLALMSKDPHAAVAELDRVVGPSGKFSQCALEVQKEILAALEARQ